MKLERHLTPCRQATDSISICQYSHRTRIFHFIRPGGDGPPKVLNFGVADNFASSNLAQSNPFGGFKGLSADTTAATSIAPVNPFGGFTGLIAPAPAAAANPFGGFTGLVTAAPAVAANPFGGFSGFIPSNKSSVDSYANKSATATTTVNPITSLSSSAPAVVESEYKRKMRKLNTSVSHWMDRQIVEHPLSIWKDGLKVLLSLVVQYRFLLFFINPICLL